MDELLRFLEMDEVTRARARRVSALLAPGMDHALEGFYRKLADFEIGDHVTAENIGRLKRKQKEHWVKLFSSQFDDSYADSARKVGLHHYAIHLDPKWYIAAYTEMKIRLIDIIVNADVDTAEKASLIQTLERCVAIDMGLALSSYTAVLVD